MTAFDRRTAILGSIDVHNSKGLEIGPLNNPLVRKSEGPILYVDHADTEFIRDVNANPRMPRDEIVDIDIVWAGAGGERPLKELVPCLMDYVVLNQVIEHIPNIVGCLLELRDAIVERGAICLGLPDRRFTFDIRRPESTAGEMIEAYLTKANRPGARHLFDQVAIGAQFFKGDAWQRDVLKGTRPNPANFGDAYNYAVRVTTTADYCDAHCWVFTPASFLDAAEILSQVGLFPFTIEYFHPTEIAEYEFYARLRKAMATERGETLASIQAARSKLENWEPEIAYRGMKSREALAKTEDESRIRALESVYESRISALETLILKYQTSRSWRVTRPLRWLGRRLRSAKATLKLFRFRAA